MLFSHWGRIFAVEVKYSIGKLLYNITLFSISNLLTCKQSNGNI